MNDVNRADEDRAPPLKSGACGRRKILGGRDS